MDQLRSFFEKNILFIVALVWSILHSSFIRELVAGTLIHHFISIISLASFTLLFWITFGQKKAAFRAFIASVVVLLFVLLLVFVAPIPFDLSLVVYAVFFFTYCYFVFRSKKWWVWSLAMLSIWLTKPFIILPFSAIQSLQWRLKLPEYFFQQPWPSMVASFLFFLAFVYLIMAIHRIAQNWDGEKPVWHSVDFRSTPTKIYTTIIYFVYWSLALVCVSYFIRKIERFCFWLEFRAEDPEKYHALASHFSFIQLGFEFIFSAIAILSILFYIRYVLFSYWVAYGKRPAILYWFIHAPIIGSVFWLIKLLSPLKKLDYQERLSHFENDKKYIDKPIRNLRLAFIFLVMAANVWFFFFFLNYRVSETDKMILHFFMSFFIGLAVMVVYMLHRNSVYVYFVMTMLITVFLSSCFIENTTLGKTSWILLFSVSILLLFHPVFHLEAYHPLSRSVINEPEKEE